MAKSTIDQLKRNDGDKPHLKFYKLTTPLPDNVLEAIRAANPAAQVAALASGRRLTVVADDAGHERLGKLLQQLDAEQAESDARSLESYPWSGEDDEQLKTLLASVAPDASVTVETAKRRVLVWATNAEHQRIAESMGKLTLTEKLVLRFYPLDQPLEASVLEALDEATPSAVVQSVAEGRKLSVLASEKDQEQFAKTLSGLVEAIGEPASRTLETYPVAPTEAAAVLASIQSLAPNAQSSLDSEERRLIVVGTPQEHMLAAKLVEKLQPTGQRQDVLIGYSLNDADAETVAEMLGELRPDVRIAADKRSNRVLVTAPLKEQPRLQAVIEQLDAKPDRRDETVVQAYRFEALNPESIVELLGPLAPEMQLTVDAENRRLLASGSSADHAKLKQWLDRINDEREGGRVAAYPIGDADPDTLRSVLLQLAPAAVPSIHPSAKQILVWASEADQKVIREAIEQFTRTAPDETRKLQTYDLPKTLAETAVDVFESVAPDATLTVDAANRKLIAWAAPAEHAALKEAFDTLLRDRPQRDLVTLQAHRAADEVLAKAKPLLEEVTPQAKMVSDDQGSWLLWALPEEHQAIERLLGELAQQLAGEPRTLKPHKVREDLLNQLSQYIGKTAPQVDLVDTPAKDQLVCWASEADHGRIEKWIREFAEAIPEQPEASLKILPIAAERMSASAMLEALDETAKAGLTIQVHAPTNSLLVRGEAAAQTRLQQAIETVLKELPPATQRESKVFRLRNAKPQTALTVLQSLVADAALAIDEEAGTFAATTTPEELRRIESVIEQLDAAPPQAGRTTKAYRFRTASAESAYEAFKMLAPNASLAFDAAANAVIATADKDAHVQFAAFAQQLDGAPRGGLVRVYPIADEAMNAEDLVEALDEDLKSKLSIQVNQPTNSLIARGDEESHRSLKAAVEAILEQLPATTRRSAKIYRFESGEPSNAAQVLSQLLPSAAITSDDAQGWLAATATEKQHATIQSVVQQMDQPRRKRSEQFSTKAYPLAAASPANVQEALAPLAPNATFSADENSGLLIVSADEQDHKRIADVVKQLDVESADAPTVRAYPIRQADANAVYQTVASAFEGSQEFSVTYQPSSRTLFVVASARNQAVFAKLVEKLDTPRPQTVARQPKVYPLSNLEGGAAESALKALFQDQYPPINIRYDRSSNAILVVAAEAQQKEVAEALRSLDGEDRELEVFSLQTTDPFAVESAIFDLFIDAPAAATPSVSADYDNNKIFVRGTSQQIQQIRALLVKLGESQLETTPGGRGDIRTIPFRGDTQRAARQIEAIWPKLSPTRLQVITPSKLPSTRTLRPGQGLIRPIAPNPSTLPPGRAVDPPAKEEPSNKEPVPAPGVPAPGVPGPAVPGPAVPGPAVPGPSAKDQSNLFPAQPNLVAVWQDSTRSPAPRPSQPAQPATGDKPADDPAKPADDPAKPADADKPKEAVVLVPEEGRVTIAGSDREALDRLEALLRAMSRGEGQAATSNLAVFLLRNTGAREMEELLTRLFQKLPSERGGLGDVVVVAEERLNALVVHGSRKDRNLIEELLQVLDTEDISDTLAANQPELLELQNMDARRALTILQTVYKTQLSSGGGRKQVSIPEGVSSAVASVLQQINAASAGPLLTLEVDAATNSLIMRAPPELRLEIKGFVERLDAQSVSRKRQIRVIPLRRTKSDQMRAILEELLQEAGK